ncbi:MAG: hypothetical protein NUW37_05530 [Planctomycetes bacterium]|nr:hypothetical protein [Planctomycetota bacterium]
MNSHKQKAKRMPYTFRSAEQAFKQDKVRELGMDSQGMRFLKLRSLSRKEHLNRLIQDHHLAIPDGKPSVRLKAVFESAITDAQIDNTIRAIHASERQQRATTEPALITELYKLQMFDWGGLHQNSLEKTIVDNYVKKIRSFDVLQTRVDDDLFHSMKSYVLCSWYNHWTSIIIEDIFRDHSSVLPAVGRIKKIDFFVQGVPYDLKVTYLPEGYIKDARKTAGEKDESALLKQYCRQHNIHFDKTLPAARLIEDLWSKVADIPDEAARAVIQDLKTRRLAILEEAKQNPVSLITWLYEMQGVRRFDASNRLFLVLVDCDNFFESWKLKRAKPLLVDKIHGHLGAAQRGGHDLAFQWEGTTYQVTSDVVFVTHQRQ